MKGKEMRGKEGKGRKEGRRKGRKGGGKEEKEGRKEGPMIPSAFSGVLIILSPTALTAKW